MLLRLTANLHSDCLLWLYNAPVGPPPPPDIARLRNAGGIDPITCISALLNAPLTADAEVGENSSVGDGSKRRIGDHRQAFDDQRACDSIEPVSVIIRRKDLSKGLTETLFDWSAT